MNHSNDSGHTKNHGNDKGYTKKVCKCSYNYIWLIVCRVELLVCVFDVSPSLYVWTALLLRLAYSSLFMQVNCYLAR